jgi:hypothetical protein
VDNLTILKEADNVLSRFRRVSNFFSYGLARSCDDREDLVPTERSEPYLYGDDGKSYSFADKELAFSELPLRQEKGRSMDSRRSEP